MSNILENKVVIITGASSGIGAASARLLAEHGCKLTLAARSLEKLEALAGDLSVETLAVRADMTAPADITNLVKRTIGQFGRIDVMFANAGVFIMGDYASGDPDAYSNLLKVNVDGVLRCIHAVIPAMKAAGCGDILITSSIAGHEELHLGAVYGASKHAIQTIVHTLRRQLAADGIRVMSLAPGRVANGIVGSHRSRGNRTLERRGARLFDRRGCCRSRRFHADASRACDGPRPANVAAKAGCLRFQYPPHWFKGAVLFSSKVGKSIGAKCGIL